MDISIAVVNAVVVTVAAIVLGWFGRGQFRALKDEIAAVESQLGARIDGVESRLGARIDGVEARLGLIDGSLNTLRSDLTGVALAVGVRPRAENA